MPDGIVVVIALFILAVIVAVLLPMAQKAAADPFVDLAAATPERASFIERGLSLYNKFSDTNDVTKGNYLQSWNPADLAAGNEDLKTASQTSDLVPDVSAPTRQGIEVRAPAMKIAESNRVYFDTEKCEKQKGRDLCSKLGSGKFNQCGVCIKGGTAYIDPDSPGKHIGGMLMINEDKEMAELAVRGTSKPAEYEPTVGECPRGYFFVDRAACEKAVKRENCKEVGATGGFDGGKTAEGKSIDAASCAAVPGISPQTYVYDPKNRAFGLVLRVLTPGRTGRNVVQVFQNGARIAYAAGLGGTEFLVDVGQKKEGAALQVVIDMEQPYIPYTGSANYRAVLLQWESANGSIIEKFEPSITALNGQGRNEEAVLPNMRKYGAFGSSKVILVPRPDSVTKDSYVVLGQQCDAGGSSHKFNVGRYDVGDLSVAGLRDDTANSIMLYNGATAKMYETSGFGGRVIDVTKNIKCFDTIDFKDKMSSLVVEAGNMKARSAIGADAQWFWAAGSPRVLRIDVKVPGTFLAPVFPEDRQFTSRNPIVTERSTFEMLRASPCMKPDQKPGKYGLSCLKTLYLAAGGVIGRGTISTDGLERLNSYGSAEAISAYLDNLFQTATRGRKASGMKASMTEINDAAMKLFGFELVSPCEDVVEGETGELMLTPKVGGLDADCLDYLWRNTGNDRDRGNEDTSRKTSLKNTYVSIRDRYSGLHASERTAAAVAAKPFQTCQPGGTLAPKDERGQVNWAAVTTANAKGSLEEVQNFYNEIHSAANYTGGQASTRASHDAALEQCYGIKRAAQTVTKVAECPRPPLLTPGTRISLSPVAAPTLFARHAGFVMWTQGNDGSFVFRNDATFKVVAGIGGTAGTISFESVNYPGYYVVHMNFRVQIYPVGSNLNWDGRRPGKREAEWKVVPGVNRVVNTYSFESNFQTGYYLGKVGEQAQIVKFDNRNGGDVSWFVKPGIA